MKHKLSAIILVFNDKGEFALQRRSAQNPSYPLHWDFSAAGGIELGERPEDAACRELKEEIGVTSSLSYIGQELYHDDQYTADLYIYQTSYNGSFKIQIEEVESIQFFPLSKIQKMIDSNEKFHPEFIFLWEKGMIYAQNNSL